LFLTDEDTFSASALINRHLDLFSPEAQLFLGKLKEKHAEQEILEHLKRIGDLSVLVIGETIIDEYVFCQVMNKSNKDPILAARHKYVERYAGGALAIANHLAGFCNHVSLLSCLGTENPQEEFVRAHVMSQVDATFLRKSASPTIVKRRFLEEYNAVKLFEVYEINDQPIAGEDEEVLCRHLAGLLPTVDLVIVADYGHGLMSDRIIQILCQQAPFLAVNAQTNAGNRGFNLVSKYPRADFVSIDEPEARLEVRDQSADIPSIIEKLSEKMSSDRFMVTCGSQGTVFRDARHGYFDTPVFSVKLVDRVGAGDACLALTAPCAALDFPPELIGFIGNVAGAEACAVMGNKTPIEPASFYRHISSLLK